MENLIYLAKVNLYWTILYVCFWLFFRRHTFFSLNRFYLLGALLISFFLPFITIPETTAENVPELVYSMSVSPVLQNGDQIAEQSTDWVLIISLVYFSGVVLLSFNMLKGFFNLFSYIRKGKAIKFEDHTLILLPENYTENGKIGSFSFFKWLVVSQDDYENCLENVLRNEMIHIKQKHSVDILIIELLKIVCWFNPVLWFYKKSMQQIHEFLADAPASDREEYATFLIYYSFNAPVQSLSNPFFNSSLLKSRVKMIFQNRTPRLLLSKYVTIFPILGLVIILTAAREKLSKISDFRTNVITNGISEYVENSTENQEIAKQPKNIKIDKKLKSVKNDTLPGKYVLDRNAYFGVVFRDMENYFYSQIKYPIEALVENIQGKVKVSFIVDEGGNIRDAEIIEGLGYGLDEEALRVVENMPKWNFAIKNGKPAAVRMTMGIDFYPALAGGRRKSDIDIKREYYNVTPKLAPQVNRLFTISEIGKSINKSLDFSDDSIPKVRFYNGTRLGFMTGGFSMLPPITISKDSVEIKH
ncbi:TonB family protein [Dyadobacter subterraneus]|uniref:TonB family protein n=1 Tax=Dyadobacter subterraneus TaxID=2773304 RepID=A0ABR9WGF3_9BACT|nr:M56 family metallopeptidase [Dyadobacter subterraneus]MBE9463431.1 TonB family protein [Dyadobacter subterraneus]